VVSKVWDLGSWKLARSGLCQHFDRPRPPNESHLRSAHKIHTYQSPLGTGAARACSPGLLHRLPCSHCLSQDLFSKRLGFGRRTFLYCPLPLFVTQRGSLRVQGTCLLLRRAQQVYSTRSPLRRHIANNITGVAHSTTFEAPSRWSLVRNAHTRRPTAAPSPQTLHGAHQSTICCCLNAKTRSRRHSIHGRLGVFVTPYHLEAMSHPWIT
jgi:hypothetical protein